MAVGAAARRATGLQAGSQASGHPERQPHSAASSDARDSLCSVVFAPSSSSSLLLFLLVLLLLLPPSSSPFGLPLLEADSNYDDDAATDSTNINDKVCFSRSRRNSCPTSRAVCLFVSLQLYLRKHCQRVEQTERVWIGIRFTRRRDLFG